MFLPQNYVLLCTESTYSISAHTLSLPLPQFAHTLTYVLMLSALLWQFYEYEFNNLKLHDLAR